MVQFSYFSFAGSSQLRIQMHVGFVTATLCRSGNGNHFNHRHFATFDGSGCQGDVRCPATDFPKALSRRACMSAVVPRLLRFLVVQVLCTEKFVFKRSWQVSFSGWAQGVEVQVVYCHTFLDEDAGRSLLDVVWHRHHQALCRTAHGCRTEHKRK